MALDLVGQARALLTRAGQLEGRAHDEDQLAFLRDERDYFNVTLVELPRGDFAFSVLRNAMVATLLKLLWERLAIVAATPKSPPSPARRSRKRATTSSMRPTGWCAWATAPTNRMRAWRRR